MKVLVFLVLALCAVISLADDGPSLENSLQQGFEAAGTGDVPVAHPSAEVLHRELRPPLTFRTSSRDHMKSTMTKTEKMASTSSMV